MIIDKGIFQTTTARIRDGQLYEIVICSKGEASLVGNVYRGRVARIVNGISAAFVDIGQEQNAYLQISGKCQVRQGDDVLVQVVKDAEGGKGAKLTQEISVPGKSVVYLPLESVIKVSRNIENQSERERLLDLGRTMTKGEYGLVIRTQAEGALREDLEKDVLTLQALWESIKQEALLGIGPKLIYQRPSIAAQAARALLDGEIQQLIVNDTEIFNEAISYLKPHGREARSKVELFNKSSDIFDYFGIKKRIKSLSSKRIWLKSGGNIIFEKTEALAVIDVNTAKSIKGHSAEDTVFKTNIEAADEIAMQIKLRDIGGIILVDFIDMKSSKNRAAILARMKSSFANEKGKTTIHGFTELGIMEISRKNEKRDISAHLLEECPCCRGNGKIQSRNFLLDSIEKETDRVKKHADVECALFEISMFYYKQLLEVDLDEIREISKIHGIGILLCSSQGPRPGEAKLSGMGSRDVLLEKAKTYAQFVEIES